MNPACEASCCDLESTEYHYPFCSPECKRVTLSARVAFNYPPKRVDGRFVPPQVAPWSWLDARAAG